MNKKIDEEIEETIHTAIEKMAEINDKDCEDIDSDDLHDLKTCVKILHKALLVKEMCEKHISNA